MRIIDLFYVSLSNLLGNKLRSFLTILGVSVGIGTIIFLVGLGFGLQKVTIDKITQSSVLTSVDVVADEDSLLKIDDESVVAISNISVVDAISPNITLPGQLNFNSTNIDVVVSGVDREYLDLSGIEVDKGVVFEDGISDNPLPIILTTTTLDLLNIENEDVVLGEVVDMVMYITRDDSSTIEELEREFKIVGLIDDESTIGYVPFSYLKGLGINEYSNLKVKAIDIDSVDIVKEEVIDLGYNTSTISDTINQANQVFKIIQIALAAMGIVALIVSSIGMFNTMTIALLERTRNIGIMKSIGASSKSIRFLFIIESGIIGILGGTTGLLIGWFGSLLVNGLLNQLAARAGAESVSLFYFPFWFILGVVIFSFAVGILTGIYPATRAAKLNPLDALRYE